MSSVADKVAELLVAARDDTLREAMYIADKVASETVDVQIELGALRARDAIRAQIVEPE